MTRQANWNAYGIYPNTPIKEQMLDDWNQAHPIVSAQPMMLQAGWNPLALSPLEDMPFPLANWKPGVPRAPLAGQTRADAVYQLSSDVELISERMP